MKIVHVGLLDKFIPPYINFIRQNFPFKEHCFFLIGDEKKYPYSIDDNIFQYTRSDILVLFRRLILADKVILHGLFDPYLILLLRVNPYLLKKCYWVMWGADLYSYMYPAKGFKATLIDNCRKYIIKHMGYLLTYLPGDVSVAREQYDSRGKYLETLGYLSNVVNFENQNFLNNKKDNVINILVGNSATKSNEHYEIFDLLTKHRFENIKIFVPLSYGDVEYANELEAYGYKIFGEKFVPMRELINEDTYLDFLRTIDIAIFNHKRQQAMGTTIQLLSIGKTVFLRFDTAQSNFFIQKGIEVNNIKSLDISRKVIHKNNQKIISNYFSEERLLSQWKNIFEG